MRWQESWKADPVARELADRHYSRQSHGHPQFVPPGRALVLRTPEGDAYWVTSWPFAQYTKHEWAGAWICSAFRNESTHLSSELILDAVSATRAHFWRDSVPSQGFVTFVDAGKTRHKRDPGRCFRRAGFRHVGYTKDGLYALQLTADRMPEPREAIVVGDASYRSAS